MLYLFQGVARLVKMSTLKGVFENPSKYPFTFSFHRSNYLPTGLDIKYVT
jgi:hypothetical protein